MHVPVYIHLEARICILAKIPHNSDTDGHLRNVGFYGDIMPLIVLKNKKLFIGKYWEHFEFWNSVILWKAVSIGPPSSRIQPTMYQKYSERTSAEVLWLRLHTPNAGGMDSVPGQKPRILHSTWQGQKARTHTHIYSGGKKPPEISQKQNLDLLCSGSYLHSIYLLLGFESNLGVI